MAKIIDFMKSSQFFRGTKMSIVFFLPLLSAFFGCKNTKEQSNSLGIYSNQNFSELKIDSQEIVIYLKKTPIPEPIRNEVVAFYTNRNNQLGWFNKGGMTCAAPNFYNQLQSYNHDFEDKSLNNADLDTFMKEFDTDEQHFLGDPKKVQLLDLTLTTTFFKYAEKVYGGTTQKISNLNWYIPRKKKNYQIVIDSLVSSELCEKLQEPVNQYYIRLRAYLKRYRTVQKKGGFPSVATQKKLLSVGDSDSCLLDLKKYLVLSNDLQTNDNSIVFTDSTSNALKIFQGRMGLLENGKLNQETITEINKPIEARIKQMMVNMERLRWIPMKMEQNYLLVNIPEFKLHIFENEKPLWNTNVVVGKKMNQTTVFRGNMSQIVLNPYWGVPTSIVKNELLPRIVQNSNYLADNNIEVTDGNYRQLPGKNNALGKMKFMFPNNFHIYLHDTPSKELFEKTKRAFSHGCIRVENPKKLVDYLLRNNNKWTPNKVNEVLQTDLQTGIKISPTVPVYIAYFTAWVDVNGKLNFRNDIYNLDQKLSKEVFENQ